MSAGAKPESGPPEHGAPSLPSTISKPLLKWAGGKRQLLTAIEKRLPEEIDTYFEPFVGGGAVFFSLQSERRFNSALLSDQNEELINTYRAVRDDADGVIRELKKLTHSEEAYYRIRGQKPRTSVRRAARMIYLNKTGYNGLYRVNRSGQFNVPFGRYVRPKICDEDRIRNVALALRGVGLEVMDFGEAVSRAKPGDSVYFDPPYVPVSKTASFAHYHKMAFGESEHKRLADLYGSLSAKGVSTVLSNSDTRVTRELYSDFSYDVVNARRSINSVSTRRGATKELLVFDLKPKSKNGRSTRTLR